MKTTWTEALLSFAFPCYCLSCGERLHSPKVHICDGCFDRLPKYEAFELFYHPQDRIEGLVPFSEIRSDLIFTKHSITRQLIHRIKYEGHPELGYKLSKTFAQRHLDLGHYPDISAIVPIPITPQSLRTRGYNQSYYIAQGIAEVYQIPIIEDALIRLPGSTQTRRDKESRWRGMTHAFEGVQDALSSKRVLIVDDVLTSGATVVHAAKTLYATCGVESVSVYTLALDVYL